MTYWVFGYGSLIWKPPPHAVEQRSGYVKGVVRRFAQSSNDHRGTPESPGIVVTLIEASDWHGMAGEEAGEDTVWGVAYRIEASKADEVKAYMEYREKVRRLGRADQNGYTCHFVDVYMDDEVVVQDAEIWIGKLDNPAFIGYRPPDQIAATIHERVGPSGANKDYLYKLAEAVRALPHVHDEYLLDLEARVRALDHTL